MAKEPFLPSLWPLNARGMDSFHSFHKEVDQLFNEFKKGFNLPTVESVSGSSAGLLSPSIDVSETDKSLNVSVELPGVEEKDVEVTLTDNVLTIKGEKKTEVDNEDKDFHVVERSYGSFQRSLKLPFEATADAVEASFENGVLKIHLEKPEELEKKVQKISIKQS